jgi:hypothetical protein
MADIQHSVQIAAKPDAIYPLVATADGFRKWWATDVTEPLHAVELSFFNQPPSIACDALLRSP